jgi:8-oxo-dGTP diphosphatase
MLEQNKYLNALSIDCVLFGFDEKELKVLLIKRQEEPLAGHWALPGGFVEPSEDLDFAARRILKELTGMPDIYMDQVHTFGNVERFPLGRVISVSYYALVKKSNYTLAHDADLIEWRPVSDIHSLVFDHTDIFKKALEKLQNKVRFHPVGFELLPEKFTLTQLQNLYERILGKSLDKRNFRKRLLGMNLVVGLDEIETGVSHRAAQYFKFDPQKYKEFLAQGFNFKI